MRILHKLEPCPHEYVECSYGRRGRSHRTFFLGRKVCRHCYKTETEIELEKSLAAGRRCGSCRWWDYTAKRCCEVKSPLFAVLTVCRFETCEFWDDLSRLYAPRESE